MAMAKNDYDWPEPVILVENSDDGKLQVNKRTLEKLKTITDHVVVVAIVGQYRTGKSYLMNRLAGKSSGFDLGSTVQSKTKGIWMWCVPHPTHQNCCLALLDTEGLDDVEKGNKENDVWIFALSILLSSTLVYNSKGTIDQRAIDDLHLVSEISENIKIKTKANEDDENDFDQIFPMFVWAVRDFELELEIDERQVSEDEYLNHALKLKPGTSRKASDYNLPRECIQRYFPKRKCCVFSKPVDSTKDLRNLDTLGDSQLVPEFVEQSRRFLQYILVNSAVKSVDGKIITGRIFASLTNCYVDSIRSGSVPCIESAVTMTAKIENQRSLDESIAMYCQEFAQRIQMPTDTMQQMSDAHHMCSKISSEFFLKLAVFDYEKLYYQQLMHQLDEKYREFCQLNEQTSKKRCNELLETFNKPVCDRLKNGEYTCPGGYQQYKVDANAVVDKYRNTARKGVMADEVLCEFSRRQEVHGTTILKTDERLADDEKKLEGERRNAEIHRQAAEAAEEARKKTEVEMTDRQRSYEEHIKRVEQQMAEENKRQQEKMEEILEKRLNEQKTLMERGFKEKANTMNDLIDDLKKKLEKKEKEENRKEMFAAVKDVLIPVAGFLMSAYNNSKSERKPVTNALSATTSDYVDKSPNTSNNSHRNIRSTGAHAMPEPTGEVDDSLSLSGTNPNQNRLPKLGQNNPLSSGRPYVTPTFPSPLGGNYFPQPLSWSLFGGSSGQRLFDQAPMSTLYKVASRDNQ